MRYINILLIMLFCYSVQGQSKFVVQSSGGVVSMPFFYGANEEKLTGLQLSFGTSYIKKSLMFGLKFTHFSHSSIFNPAPLELEYNDDLSIVRYGNEFYQRTTTVNHAVVTLFTGYNFGISDFFKIQLKYGVSFITGNESRTLLSAPGNYEPTKVGYKKDQGSGFALGYYSIALLGKITNSLSVGLDFTYQEVLQYKGLGLMVQTKI